MELSNLQRQADKANGVIRMIHCTGDCNQSSLLSHVRVNRGHLLDFIAAEDKAEAAIARRIQAHKRLEVMHLAYEQFSKTPDWCRVLEFINVMCTNLTGATKKRIQAGLNETITNFDEVRAAVASDKRAREYLPYLDG